MNANKSTAPLNLKNKDQFARSILMNKISQLKEARLEFEESFSTEKFVRSFEDLNDRAPLTAKITIHHARAYSRILLGGTIGAAESYMDGDWDCDNLTALMQIFVRNRTLMNQLESGIGAVSKPFLKLAHTLNKNSIKGSKKNIQAHYDLGNDFFKCFLDSNWMYSSAIFLDEHKTLDEAQFEKVDRICRKLNLKPTDHLLEIGTGWGGFAIHAAKHYGCKVTTTTISKEQFKVASERVKAEKCEDKVTILLEDYRLLTGKYDKCVSIEMIEAVGLNFLDTYFECCSRLLKPNGQFLLQAITIRDEFYEVAKKNVDFIQRYVFPGSGIPSISAMMNSVKKKTDLQMIHLEDFGLHYAKTLNIWSKNLTNHKLQLDPHKYPEKFYRLWKYYFSYCEGGFLERSIGVSQLLFSKPLATDHLWSLK